MNHELLNVEDFVQFQVKNMRSKMKVSTQNCQMVKFMCSVGEEDLIPYCSFAGYHPGSY